MIEKEKLISIFNEAASKFPKADEVAAIAIRKAITTGTLPPGELINEMEIAGYLQLSRMPIRQAMVVLESEGLVRRVYKKGVFVTELSKDEIEEIYNMRARLEGLAILQAVPNLTKSDLSKSRQLLEEVLDADSDIERFPEINAEFHLNLYRASSWQNLLRKINELRNNCARYIPISHHLRNNELAEQNAIDHKLIFEACKKGDAEAAEKLTEEHLYKNMKVLLESF